MTYPEEDTIDVDDGGDVVLAGRSVKSMLADCQFEESAVEEVVLVVHELASNIVKHAGEGTITLSLLRDEDQERIEIIARDSGPGIVDVDRAVADGYSTVGSLGGGLGSIHRLMDEVVIDPEDDPESGVEITARRWSSTSPVPDQPTPPPLDVGAATRPKPGEEKNGDAFVIEHGTGQSLVGVIDGLGHGAAAHAAASKAKQFVLTHSSQSLADIFAGVERVCRGTRGVVMVLARFDRDDGSVRLGSVGNVTLRVCHSSESPHLVSRRGVVGGNGPDPAIVEWDWDQRAVMVVHSDGVSSEWDCGDFPLRSDDPVTEVAADLLRSRSRRTDDATVLVVRGSDDR